MFKDLKLSVKLIGGFVLVAIITLGVGFAGWWGANNLSAHLHEVGDVRLPSLENLVKIDTGLERLVSAQRTLLNPYIDQSERDHQYQALESAREYYRAAWDIYEPLPHTPEEARLWEQFEKAIDEWAVANNQFTTLSQELDKSEVLNPAALSAEIQQFRGDHYRLISQVQTLIMDGTTFEGGESHTTCAFGQWIEAQNFTNPAIVSALNNINQPHKQFHDSIGQIKDLINRGNQDEAIRVYQTVLVPSAETTFGYLYSIIEEAERVANLHHDMEHQAMTVAAERQAVANELLEKIVLINEEIAHDTILTADRDATAAQTIALAGMAIGFVLALTLGIFLSISITGPVNRIIASLTDGSEQVSAASGQVSGASQTLAEGASEQAASLEEISSSLEEMASMTKQNASNAEQGDALMSDARSLIVKGQDAMGRLTNAISEIKASSDETAKIVKTIDEIAFQTNLLALNAAVEAARAGDAGKGFAVVAEEVRNLAQRSAEAARNTSALIEGSIQNSERGASVSKETAEAMNEITVSAQKVAELVAEIAAASKEQAQGIDQVNIAVTQMDKVTQGNASSAEESASASEELNAQAEGLSQMVDELIAFVGSAKPKSNSMSIRPVQKHKSAHNQIHHYAPPARKSNGKKPAMTSKNERVPAEVIPLGNDESFDDF